MPGFDDRIEELRVGLMKPDVDLLKLAKIVTLEWLVWPKDLEARFVKTFVFPVV